MYIYEVIPDGLCMYRSIVRGLFPYFDQEEENNMVKSLRRAVHKIISSSDLLLSMWSIDNEDKHIDRMLVENIYGSNVDLTVIAYLLGATINIYERSGNKIVKKGIEDNYKFTKDSLQNIITNIPETEKIMKAEFIERANILYVNDIHYDTLLLNSEIDYVPINLREQRAHKLFNKKQSPLEEKRSQKIIFRKKINNSEKTFNELNNIIDNIVNDIIINDNIIKTISLLKEKDNTKFNKLVRRLTSKKFKKKFNKKKRTIIIEEIEDIPNIEEINEPTSDEPTFEEIEEIGDIKDYIEEGPMRFGRFNRRFEPKRSENKQFRKRFGSFKRFNRFRQ